eukprot:747507-Hanusia_phi.AAC.2
MAGKRMPGSKHNLRSARSGNGLLCAQVYMAGPDGKCKICRMTEGEHNTEHKFCYVSDELRH